MPVVVYVPEDTDVIFKFTSLKLKNIKLPFINLKSKQKSSGKDGF